MTEPNPAKDRFLAALHAIRANGDTPTSSLTGELTDALLAYGSETEDNVAAVGRIGVRDVPLFGDRRAVGPAIKDHGILVSDILNRAEESEIPDPVRESYPELDRSDWQAALRLATLVMTAIERGYLHEEEADEDD
ncbi:DUF433 domain-containing protein [Amycolatopsis aidingensis]|uniref:hypothetical protein n=1 Tax=Amycolatopsis aidingensis TaxID=2842453 RepID=UPI001C0E1619|nr:hypothetical protein [Amycolatopsis aidingensis]